MFRFLINGMVKVEVEVMDARESEQHLRGCRLRYEVKVRGKGGRLRWNEKGKPKVKG